MPGLQDEDAGQSADRYDGGNTHPTLVPLWDEAAFQDAGKAKAQRAAVLHRHGQGLRLDQTVKMVFPYAALCPDNQRHGVVMIKRKPRIILTSKYRKAKESISLLAMGQYRGEPMTGELDMEATLYAPTARRTDPSNFSKCLHDALEGVVYRNDSQIRRSTYIRGEIDRLNPRIEITVLPSVGSLSDPPNKMTEKSKSEELGENQEDVRLLPHLSTTTSTAPAT